MEVILSYLVVGSGHNSVSFGKQELNDKNAAPNPARRPALGVITPTDPDDGLHVGCFHGSGLSILNRGSSGRMRFVGRICVSEDNCKL